MIIGQVLDSRVKNIKNFNGLKTPRPDNRHTIQLEKCISRVMNTLKNAP